MQQSPQTDLINCGGNGGLAAWFAVARATGIDVRAVGDLDCILDPAVARTIDTFPDVAERYQRELYIEPPRTSTVVRPLLDAASAASVSPDPKSRAAWIAGHMVADGNTARLSKLLEVWRDANLWLHAQGTLEALLGLSESEKNRESIAAASGEPGPIDAVVEWAAYRLDPSGEVLTLLEAAVEQIAHRLLEALRVSPDERFDRAVGSTSESDARIAAVSYIEASGKHRITVRRPEEYSGYWVEVDRQTPPSEIVLRRPSDDAQGVGD